MMQPYALCNLNGTAGEPLQARNGAKVILPVSSFSYATVQVVPAPSGTGAAAWSTAVITVGRSNDIDGPAAALESAVTITTSTRMTGRIDVRGFSFLILTLTTAEGAASLANVYITATGGGS